MADLSAAGWPRPFRRWEPRDESPARLLPVPWVNGPCVEKRDNWLDFREDVEDAHHDRLCAVCGEQMAGLIVLGKYGRVMRLTSGPGGHPRCMALTVKMCPHFARKTRHEVVAYLYAGSGPGYLVENDDLDPYSQNNVVRGEALPITHRELKELAARDPLGLVG